MTEKPCYRNNKYCYNLRAIRQAKGMTQRELEIKAFLGENHLYHLERLQYRARPSTVELLAAALGCSPEDITERVV